MARDECAFTAEEKWHCAKRELQMRKRVYPRWVEKGNMTAEKSKKEIELMAAIADDYCALDTKEHLL